MEYKKTLNMPKSGFPMRAGLAQREPDMLKHWEEIDLYNELLKKNEGKPLFVLQRCAAHGSRAEQGAEGLHHPQLRHARLLHALYPRLG